MVDMRVPGRAWIGELCRSAGQRGVAVLDSDRVTALRLHLPDEQRDALVLEPGVHAVSPALLGVPVAPGRDETIAHLYVDSRGLWLRLREGLRGAYVNGRPIRHMAMLRAGDSLFLQGVEAVVTGRRPEPAEAPRSPPKNAPRCVLRAVGGPLHGRCYPLDRPLVLGRAAECAVVVDDPAVAPYHAEFRTAAQGVVVAVDSDATALQANGHAFTGGLLCPGDQFVVAGQHRFLVEAPRADGCVEPEPAPPPRPAARPRTPPLRRNVRRIPWLLLAALLLAAALSALLLYGAG